MVSTDLSTSVDANVLVIGGGFAGTWAALRAAERIPGVVLVDKAYVSRSGASTMSGGVTMGPQPDDDLEKWVEEFAVLGGYEADQDWSRILVHEQVDRIAELESWGVPIVKNDDGTYARIKSRGMINVRALQFSPREAMEALRRNAENAGAKILDRVQIVELITSDGKYPTNGHIVGAIGFDAKDGSSYVIRAKRVILATGPLSMKGSNVIGNVVADGHGMAYRAGAKFQDMEFAGGGTFSYVWGQYHMGGFNVSVGHGGQLINALGERFMERYDPVRYERSELSRVVMAFAKELMDGRGPVYFDLTKTDDGYWDALKRARAGRQSVLIGGPIPDPKTYPMPIEPTWKFWIGSGTGGIFTDTECRTNIPGLLAVGSVRRNSGVGRHASAGSPTAHCMVSGARAGITAAAEAREMELPALSDDVVGHLKNRMYSSYDSGADGNAEVLHHEVRSIMGSSMDVMIQNESRLVERLERISKYREEMADFKVGNAHEMVKLHEASNSLDSMELIYACMLERRESRGSFYREDFPLTDDRTWLCWHTARRSEDGMTFEREAIPFDRYTYKPDEPVVMMSPLAAIMDGSFDPELY